MAAGTVFQSFTSITKPAPVRNDFVGRQGQVTPLSALPRMAPAAPSPPGQVEPTTGSQSLPSNERTWLGL